MYSDGDMHMAAKHSDAQIDNLISLQEKQKPDV